MVDGPAPTFRAPLTLRLSAGLHGTALGVGMLHQSWWLPMLGMVAANHAALTAIGMWPRSQAFGPTMARLGQAGSAGGADIR